MSAVSASSTASVSASEALFSGSIASKYFRQDLVEHCVACLVLAIVLAMVTHHTCGYPRAIASWVGLCMSIVVGAAKEAADALHWIYGVADWVDFGADCVGAIIGASVFLVVLRRRKS